MMTAIWKFPLDVMDNQSVEMPINSHILCCQVQDDRPCLWAVCQTDTTVKQSRQIEIVGTGHSMEDCNRGYIDTFQLHGGGRVFHVFERYDPVWDAKAEGK